MDAKRGLNGEEKMRRQVEKWNWNPRDLKNERVRRSLGFEKIQLAVFFMSFLNEQGTPRNLENYEHMLYLTMMTLKILKPC